jgi:hypothetical protein
LNTYSGHKDASMERLAVNVVSVCFLIECLARCSLHHFLVILYGVFVIDIGLLFDLTSGGHGHGHASCPG